MNSLRDCLLTYTKKKDFKKTDMGGRIMVQTIFVDMVCKFGSGFSVIWPEEGEASQARAQPLALPFLEKRMVAKLADGNNRSRREHNGE